MDNTQKQFLTAKARQLRDDVIETIGRFGSGHIGGSMSVMDALTVIYYAKANVDPKNPKKIDRDRVIMSKGHARRSRLLSERGASHSQSGRDESPFSLRYEQDSRHRHDGRIARTRVFVCGRYGSRRKNRRQSGYDILLYRRR